MQLLVNYMWCVTMSLCRAGLALRAIYRVLLPCTVSCASVSVLLVVAAVRTSFVSRHDDYRSWRCYADNHRGRSVHDVFY